MSRTTITVDAEQELVSELDRIANTLKVERGEIIREALQSYIGWDRDFRDSVEQGIREADAGLLIDHEEVMEIMRRKMTTASKRSGA